MLKISIVMVCYNMEKYIEQTMISVLNQNYPMLEYIVIDGGSTDSTCSIIEKYKDRLAYFVSEPDNGMYDAINKGFSKATGDILGWLNADDQYMPWTFDYVNHAFSLSEDIEWISGVPAFMNKNRFPTRIYTFPGAKSRKDIIRGRFNSNDLGCLQQEGMFWRKSLYYKVGGLNVNLRYAGDFELWTRFAQITDLVSIDVPLAMFMQRDDSLSIGGNDKYEDEIKNILKKRGFKYGCVFSKYKILVVLNRIFKRAKTPVIYYSIMKSELIYKKIKRSSAYYSLMNVLLFNQYK